MDRLHRSHSAEDETGHFALGCHMEQEHYDLRDELIRLEVEASVLAWMIATECRALDASAPPALPEGRQGPQHARGTSAAWPCWQSDAHAKRLADRQDSRTTVGGQYPLAA